jgi:hypothetical protein
MQAPPVKSNTQVHLQKAKCEIIINQEKMTLRHPDIDASER